MGTHHTNALTKGYHYLFHQHDKWMRPEFLIRQKKTSLILKSYQWKWNNIFSVCFPSFLKLYCFTLSTQFALCIILYNNNNIIFRLSSPKVQERLEYWGNKLVWIFWQKAVSYPNIKSVHVMLLNTHQYSYLYVKHTTALCCSQLWKWVLAASIPYSHNRFP